MSDFPVGLSDSLGVHDAGMGLRVLCVLHAPHGTEAADPGPTVRWSLFAELALSPHHQVWVVCPLG